jgi:hypothetical protein
MMDVIILSVVKPIIHNFCQKHILGLHHPLDGVTNPKYKVLGF